MLAERGRPGGRGRWPSGCCGSWSSSTRTRCRADRGGRGSAWRAETGSRAGRDTGNCRASCRRSGRAKPGRSRSDDRLQAVAVAPGELGDARGVERRQARGEAIVPADDRPGCLERLRGPGEARRHRGRANGWREPAPRAWFPTAACRRRTPAGACRRPRPPEPSEELGRERFDQPVDESGVLGRVVGPLAPATLLEGQGIGLFEAVGRPR